MKASSSPPSLRTMLRREKTVPKISLALSPAARERDAAVEALVLWWPLVASWEDGLVGSWEAEGGGVSQSLEYIHSAGWVGVLVRAFDGEVIRGQWVGSTVSIEYVEGIHLDRHGSGCCMRAFTCRHLFVFNV